MNYFSSDWHLGHKEAIIFGGRPFKNVLDMNRTIIDNMIKPLEEGDNFYF